jgi:hypothetical protein
MGRRAKKMVGGDEKWHQIIGGFQGSFLNISNCDSRLKKI